MGDKGGGAADSSSEVCGTGSDTADDGVGRKKSSSTTARLGELFCPTLASSWN